LIKGISKREGTGDVGKNGDLTCNWDRFDGRRKQWAMWMIRTDNGILQITKGKKSERCK
jgi:hypothetical protein